MKKSKKLAAAVQSVVPTVVEPEHTSMHSAAHPDGLLQWESKQLKTFSKYLCAPACRFIAKHGYEISQAFIDELQEFHDACRALDIKSQQLDDLYYFRQIGLTALSFTLEWTESPRFAHK